MIETYKYLGYELIIEFSEIKNTLTSICEELGFYSYNSLEDSKKYFRIRVGRELKEQYEVSNKLSELIDIPDNENTILAQNLFTYILLRCPEALAETIESLDTLQNKYSKKN